MQRGGILLGQEVLLLGCDEVRAVDCEQRLAFAHEITGCVDVDLTNPSRKTRLHIRQTPFIRLDIAVEAEFVTDWLVLDLPNLYANALHALGGKLHRSE